MLLVFIFFVKNKDTDFIITKVFVNGEITKKLKSEVTL